MSIKQTLKTPANTHGHPAMRHRTVRDRRRGEELIHRYYLLKLDPKVCPLPIGYRQSSNCCAYFQ